MTGSRPRRRRRRFVGLIDRLVTSVDVLPVPEPPEWAATHHVPSPGWCAFTWRNRPLDLSLPYHSRMEEAPEWCRPR